MENHNVRMVRPHLDTIPAAPLPDGWAMRPFAPDDVALWTAIIREGETFSVIHDDLWNKQFGDDPDAAPARIFFLCDPSGQAVGTISAWYGDKPPFAGWGRIHWVTILPAYQGQGLGKAMLTFALHRLRELGHTNAYLYTSSGRLPALRMYRNYGFTPDPWDSNNEAVWQQINTALDSPAR